MISVLVTAQGNSLGLSRLLDQLALNDLAPRLYEVLVVDSGSRVDLAEIVNVPNRPITTRLYSGSTCGKSRNRALAVARGDWIVFLDDQALPGLDGLRRHVVGQSGLGGTTGILGDLTLCDEQMETRLDEAARYSGLFSPRMGLDSGKRYPWTAFDTRNLSICRSRLVEVGGFDAKLDSRQALDLDIGRRLHESSGIELLFDSAIVALSTEKVDARVFIRRQQELGAALYQTWQETGDDSLLTDSGVSREFWWDLRADFEKRTELVPAKIQRLMEAGEGAGQDVGLSRRALLDDLSQVGVWACQQGLLQMQGGFEPHQIEANPSLRAQRTSCLICVGSQHDGLLECVESLQANTNGHCEVLVLSPRDPSAVLGHQNVTWIRIEEWENCQQAWARGIEVARGRTLVLFDRPVRVAVGWREILLKHLVAWPDIGLAVPVSHQLAGCQKPSQALSDGRDFESVAMETRTTHAGQHRYVDLAAPMMSVGKREVLAELFRGSEHNLFVTVRREGLQVRVARDCLVLPCGNTLTGEGSSTSVAEMNTNGVRALG